jgi:hypothetical protein
MNDACPSCGTPFDPQATRPGMATRRCGHCGHVVVAVAQPGSGISGAEDEPLTAPFLEAALEADLPTSIGAAGPLLRLPAGKRIAVAIVSGERKGEVVTLAGPRLTVGCTGGGADLQLPDPGVSRSHAAVECHGPRIVLRDLESRNGTFVGDARIGQRVVEDRTEFRIGATTLLVVITDP